MYEPGPDSKGWGVDRQNFVGQEQTIEPGFELSRPGGVLLAGDFDSGLDFADGDGGDVELICRHAGNPVQHGPVG